MNTALTAEDACERLNVSRETGAQFEEYVALLTEWQSKINLVSKASLDDVWERHIVDSGQIFELLPQSEEKLLDIGSGAGLPGLILAMMGAEKVILVESDRRKCAFLHAAIERIGIKAEIINERVENLAPLYPSVITARALAPLAKLLTLTKAQHHPSLTCLFMKGKTYHQDLTCLANYPNLNSEIIKSQTSPDSAIIKLTGFR